MKYIILLFSLFVFSASLAVTVVIKGFFEDNRFLDILSVTGPGLLVSGTYFAVYVFLLSRLRKSIYPIKVHSFFREVNSYVFHLFIFIGPTIICLILAITRMPTMDGMITSGIGIFCVFSIVNKLFNRMRKDGFLAMYFDKKGAHLISFVKRDIMIPWSECVEIGVGSESTGAHPTLYFAKDHLTDGQLAEMSKTQINDRLIRIGYREDVYEDALQYADRSKVKDFKVV